jgi:dephospho-CoA kinase
MIGAENIALSGRSGSGKTQIADYLVEKHGYTRCSSGAACREICKKLFGTDSKAILNRVTDALKAVDPDVWLRAALSSAPSDRPVVFDSMRFSTDYAFLKGRGFLTWRIEAPHNVRLDRMRERHQEVMPEDDEHRAETELDQQVFDQIIDNSEAGLALLYSKIELALS